MQPHAGAQTNMAVYFAALQPGDTILSMRARPRRPPHARAQGQLLGAALHDRRLRRGPRDLARRLRRGASAREGAPAEADHLRRLRVPARDRGRPLPRDRRRGRRSCCATWRTSRGSSPPGLHPEPDAALRLRHLDDAQDARRPARGFVLCKEELAKDVDRAVFPGMQGGRSSTRSRRRPRASGSR